MPEINLRDLYPDQYKEDCFIEVSDAVADVFTESKRSEDTAKRKMYRYHAQYSLDQNDGIEREILEHSIPLSDILVQFESRQSLAEALSILTPVQVRRIYTRYFLNIPSSEIAKIEGISKRSINESIRSGMQKLQEYLKNP